MKSSTSNEPMERIAVDILGPLPLTTKGNRFIVIVADYFTKWVEGYAVANHQAETIAEVLVNNIFNRFGLPQTLHSDQGRDFECPLFQQVCQLLGIHKTRTTPWHPQSDGMIERFNRTLEAMLRELVTEKQTDWDTYVSTCCSAYRAVPHEATKFTPNRMMLGRELPLPSHLLAQPPERNPVSRVAYVEKLEEIMQDTHQRARTHLKSAQVHAKREYDKSSREQKWEVDQWVWTYNPSRKVGISLELQQGWEKEPYEIQKMLNDVVFLIQRFNRGKKRIIHVNKLQAIRDPEKILQELKDPKGIP